MKLTREITFIYKFNPPPQMHSIFRIDEEDGYAASAAASTTPRHPVGERPAQSTPDKVM